MRADRATGGRGRRDCHRPVLTAPLRRLQDEHLNGTNLHRPQQARRNRFRNPVLQCHVRRWRRWLEPHSIDETVCNSDFHLVQASPCESGHIQGEGMFPGHSHRKFPFSRTSAMSRTSPSSRSRCLSSRTKAPGIEKSHWYEAVPEKPSSSGKPVQVVRTCSRVSNPFAVCNRHGPFKTSGAGRSPSEARNRLSAVRIW